MVSARRYKSEEKTGRSAARERAVNYRTAPGVRWAGSVVYLVSLEGRDVVASPRGVARDGFRKKVRL